MENIFPSLLTYSFFAPLVLRVCIALVFFADAKRYWDKKDRGLVLGIAFIIGTLLLVGYLAQLAALLGLIYVGSTYYKKNPSSAFVGKTVALLAAAILVSLLMTGAGGLAFDIRL